MFPSTAVLTPGGNRVPDKTEDKTMLVSHETPLCLVSHLGIATWDHPSIHPRGA